MKTFNILCEVLFKIKNNIKLTNDEILQISIFNDDNKMRIIKEFKNQEINHMVV